MVVLELRKACERVADRSRHVQINVAQIPLYAASLPPAPPVPTVLACGPERADATWYWLTLNAMNFGSGWFPTLRKRPGRTGYGTVSSGLKRHFDLHGHWPAEQLSQLEAATIAAVLDQDPTHELMGLFAASLRDLGDHLGTDVDGDPQTLVRSANFSALALVDTLASWACFRDVSDYAGIELPFNKRAQITAADLARAGAAQFDDLARLTMFADNLVPHVLRLDGILEFDPDLVARIEHEELIEHGSPEEVEIRACAVQAVELIVAAGDHQISAAQVDELLWQRGQGRLYKSSPRHRSRSTAY